MPTNQPELAIPEGKSLPLVRWPLPASKELALVWHVYQQSLVRRWPLDVIDHEYIHLPFVGNQLESKLLFKRREYRRPASAGSGGRLNYHPNLHIMVSAGGLKPAESRVVQPLEFNYEQITDLWRFAVTSYLWKAHHDGLHCESALPEKFDDLIHKQVQKCWNIHITRRMSKMHFLAYAGRYIRRLPISEKRIFEVTKQEVVYQSKDTRTKTLLEIHSTPAKFIATLSQHVLNRYKHSMRYFGLLAPRARRLTLAPVFALLGQQPRPMPEDSAGLIRSKSILGLTRSSMSSANVCGG